MGYFRGLKLQGEVYVYRFKLNGLLERGSTKCRIYEDAVKWLNHYKSQISLGNIGVHNPPILEKLLDEWKKTASLTNDPQQIASMDSAIRTHCKQLLKVKVDKLTTQLVKRVLLRYTKSRGKGPGRKSHSSGGANALLLRLNTLMGYAIDCNYITRKPYAIRREKSQAQPRTIIRAPKIKEFLIALEKNTRSTHVRLAIALQAGLGLRESEALGAEWQWINWETNSIQVVRFFRPTSLSKKKIRTKNKQIRTLPLPVWLRTRLLAHWNAVGKPKTGLVLPSDRPGLPHISRYTAHALGRIGMALELEALTPHGLRSGWITSLLHDAKVPLTEAQKMAGHAEITTTAGYDQGPEHHRNAIMDLEKAQGLLPIEGGVCRKLKRKYSINILSRIKSSNVDKKNLDS